MHVVRIYEVTDEDRAEITRVREYAELPAHYHVAHPPGVVPPGGDPGERPEYVATCPGIGLRCVFTITDWRSLPALQMGLTRHLSVSTLGARLELPDVYAVDMILPSFGIACGIRGSFMGAAEYNPRDPIANCVFLCNLDGTPCLPRA